MTCYDVREWYDQLWPQKADIEQVYVSQADDLVVDFTQECIAGSEYHLSYPCDWNDPGYLIAIVPTEYFKTCLAYIPENTSVQIRSHDGNLYRRIARSSIEGGVELYQDCDISDGYYHTVTLLPTAHVQTIPPIDCKNEKSDLRKKALAKCLLYLS